MENYEHYITRTIKNISIRKLFSPIIYLLILVIIWLNFPLTQILFPTTIGDSDSIKDLYNQNDIYIEGNFNDLYFTGYTRTIFGHNTGYYYYTIFNDECIFLLLSPNTCEEGLPSIDNVHLQGIIEKNTATFQTMLTNLAEDLNWTSTDLSKKVSTYYISEPGYLSFVTYSFLAFYFISGFFALFSLITNILYILFPVLSPPCRRLGRFGRASKLLELAEHELATLPQLATEDMFITEHFFIETSNYGIAIVPIHEIIWIYKYSTLHKVFWYHFSISYTLHITANHHMHIRCPKNIKSDIDGIIDYLSEANHEILVGFSEENRLKVQDMKETKLHLEQYFEKFIALLKKRI